MIANLSLTTIEQAQPLNLPVVVIGVTGFFAGSERLPRTACPLGVLTDVLACYAVMVAYPSKAGVVCGDGGWEGLYERFLPAYVTLGT